LDPKKESDTKSVIKNLEFIESRLHYLIEARDYNVAVNPSKGKEILDYEKKLETQRRVDKIEKIK